jgi:hypothetical protein
VVLGVRNTEVSGIGNVSAVIWHTPEDGLVGPKHFWVLTTCNENKLGKPVPRLAIGWTAEGSSSYSSRARIFLLSKFSEPVMGPTQPPVQWVSGALSAGVNGRGVKLTIHLQLVPWDNNTWICASTPPHGA